MDWIQVLVIIGGNIGVIIPLFLWIRSEANADRRDMLKIALDIHNDIQNQMNEFRNDMRDFHGRLCSLEERNKK